MDRPSLGTPQRQEVSGKQVLVQWFSGRRKHRERPLIGDRRKPSPLIDDAVLRQAGVFSVTEAPKRKAAKASGGPDLLTDVPSLGG